MAPKTKDMDNTLFYMLLVLAVLSIAGAVFLLIITKENPETFTTIGFDSPETLPNKVKTGQEHSFQYTIQSFEDKETKYELNSKLELYRLYDTTEGLYSCLSPYRRKVHISWENDTELRQVSIPDENDLIPDMAIQPDKANKITWDTYYLDFSLGRKYGKGEFVIYFESNNKTKYKYSLNEKTKQIYFDGTPVGVLNLSKQNDKVRISYDGKKVSLMYNGLLIHEAEVFAATYGQFGFESRDMFVDVSRMSVHKNKEVEIPDKENIWEYDVKDQLFYNKISEARRKASKTIKMTRNYIIASPRTETPGILNETQEKEEPEYDCKNEYACNYLKNEEKTYNIQENNITSLILSMPDTNYGSNFWLQTRKYNDSLIIWENFTMKTEYDSLFDTDSIFFVFGEDFALQINKGSFSLITNSLEGLQIEQYPLEGQQNYSALGHNQDNFSIIVNKNNIKINIGDLSLEKKITSTLKDKPFKMFHLNTYSTVRSVDLRNSKESCNTGDDEFYEFCEIIYEFQRTRPPTPKLDVTQYGSLYVPEISTTKDTQDIPTDLIPEVDKIKIPTKTVSFDGPISIIQNKTNRTFGAEYKYLDGKGIVDITLHDLDGNALLTLTTDAANKRADIKYFLEGKEYEQGYRVRINRLIWQKWEIKLLENNIEITLNNTKIFDIPLQIRSGYFSMTTEETHIEKRHTYIQNINTGKRINFPLLEDPCKLRLVYKEELYSDEIILKPGEEKSIENNFDLNTYFDYGKIDVSLNGSTNTNNTALGIHFWMVRT